MLCQRNVVLELPAVMSYIASVLLLVTPDIIYMERLGSLYNDAKTVSRSWLSKYTIYDHLSVAFKSTGTANLDPQRVVSKLVGCVAQW